MAQSDDIQRLKTRLSKKDSKHLDSIVAIVGAFNEITGRDVKVYNKGALKLMLYWLNDGYEVKHFRGVFDYKYRQFKGTDNEKYINIDTFCRQDRFEDNLERARQEWRIKKAEENKRREQFAAPVGHDLDRLAATLAQKLSA